MPPLHFLLLSSLLRVAFAQTTSTESPDLSTSTPDLSTSTTSSTPDLSTTLSTSPERTTEAGPSGVPADSYLDHLNSTTGLVEDPRAVLRGRDINCFITWFRGDSRSAYWLRHAVNKFYTIPEERTDVSGLIGSLEAMGIDERMDVTDNLKGVNIRLMKWIADESGANFRLYAVNERVADPDANQTDSDADHWTQILYYLNPSTTPQYDCRFLQVGFSFFVLMILAAWTANLAAFLTTQGEGRITSIDDLRPPNPSLSKYTHICYWTRWEEAWLGRHYNDIGKKPVRSPEESLKEILKGGCNASVGADVHFRGELSDRKLCDLKTIGHPLSIIQYAIPWRSGMDQAPVVAAMNQMIAEAVIQSEIDKILGQFMPFNPQEKACKEDKRVIDFSSETTPLTDDGVGGVGILFGCAVGASTLILLIYDCGIGKTWWGPPVESKEDKLDNILPTEGAILTPPADGNEAPAPHDGERQAAIDVEKTGESAIAPAPAADENIEDILDELEQRRK
ncbi:unnamed protein product [Vitrella brassicaformis CCMP3155]|uniref:Ionotropic glutamate receptor C-terminal domain-containing protein n=1 Tax=Vitrella brassicaformis (strain CCMP3155) TaxID=1169540 RepID=A0A0G4FV65_VITBC|nr:unnamed protein product [Vitrella brassicaformis CCMP3155]|eukprot:CEM18560.1 unnamed protein product [Vitrella brassicaformis CCMP3155]